MDTQALSQGRNPQDDVKFVKTPQTKAINVVHQDKAHKRDVPPPKQSCLGEWAKLIAVTGSAQVMVQALGFFGGILVIRLLPTHEYALYILANTMLATMTMLADGGIATGVMSQGGKVWQDKQKLGAVLVTGMQLRKKFAVFSLMLAMPVLFYLLRKHDASWLMSGLIVLSLIPAFFTSLSGTLLEIIPKLQQDIAPLQKIQVAANAGRLALLGLTLFVYPFAAVAIACAGGSQIWSNWRLRKISYRYVDRAQAEDLEVRTKILSFVKRIMPGTVYYCFSGQITIWLISIFGTTDVIAQVGALSRLAMLFSILSTLIGILVVPRFARLPNNRKLLCTRFIQINASVLMLCATIFISTWCFPTQFLWILGEKYNGLIIEVILISAIGAVGILVGTILALNSSRGFLPTWYFYPSSGILAMIGISHYSDFTTAIGVLNFNLLLMLFSVFSATCVFFLKLSKDYQ
ncbi:MAG: hypothetical protein WAW36_03195 [Methylovulum miyakonense]|uniref:hypothetical protein n=1 Tax=Methylovulum miyakonense TaxID=645578 RepID=UPI003BB7DF68